MVDRGSLCITKYAPLTPALRKFQSFKSSVPGARTKTKYTVLIISQHHRAAQTDFVPILWNQTRPLLWSPDWRKGPQSPVLDGGLPEARVRGVQTGICGNWPTPESGRSGVLAVYPSFCLYLSFPEIEFLPMANMERGLLVRILVYPQQRQHWLCRQVVISAFDQQKYWPPRWQ